MIALLHVAPLRNLFILALLLLAGLAEGVGIATVLPLLALTGLATGTSPNANEGMLGDLESGALSDAFADIFEFIGYTPGLGELLILIVLVFWLKAGLVLFARAQIGYAASQFATALRVELLQGLMRARWPYFTGQPVGLIANAVTTESSNAAAAYSSTFNLITLAIQILVYLGIAVILSWKLTVSAIVVGGGVFTAFHVLTTLARRAGRQQRISFNKIVGNLVDNLQGIKPVKAMALENLVGPMLEAETQVLNRALRLQVISKAGLQALIEPTLVSILAVGLFLTISLLGASLTGAIVVAIVFYRTLAKLMHLQGTYQTFAINENFLQSISRKLGDVTDERELLAGQRQPKLDRAIEFKDVSFSFGENQVLDRVSLSVPAGKITAIIGPSGSGKTTLVDLVIGLFRPQSGEIYLDGAGLADIDLRAWRRLIGYVPQELILFNDTLLANVTLNDPEISEADAIEALRAAGAQSFIDKLPDGLHSMAGERGTQLSGGQRQRIAIARAIARRPKLLLLDEPTTALDPRTEAEICNTLKALSSQLTILAISHQQAIRQIADIVYNIDDGTVRSENEQRATTDEDRDTVADMPASA